MAWIKIALLFFLCIAYVISLKCYSCGGYVARYGESPMNTPDCTDSGFRGSKVDKQKGSTGGCLKEVYVSGVDRYVRRSLSNVQQNNLQKLQPQQQQQLLFQQTRQQGQQQKRQSRILGILLNSTSSTQESQDMASILGPSSKTLVNLSYVHPLELADEILRMTKYSYQYYYCYSNLCNSSGRVDTMMACPLLALVASFVLQYL